MVNEQTRAYGRAELNPTTEVIAGTYTNWTITYHVGQLGMDHGSRLKIATRGDRDWGPPQFETPDVDNFCSVHTSGDATVKGEFEQLGHRRPWSDTIKITVLDGYLQEGDTITAILGDTTSGSRGIQANSFVENPFGFKVLVDAFTTNLFMEVPGECECTIVGGPPASLEASLPSGFGIGEEIQLSIRILDEWGNISPESDDLLELEATDEEGEVPEVVEPQNGVATVPVTFHTPGCNRIIVRSQNHDLMATTNATVSNTDYSVQTFWGDLHGQSEETVGTGTVDEYFEFARDRSFLDFAAPAHHDSQLTDQDWERVKSAVNKYHCPEDFVTFLGYEWSANTPVGGDHNIYFRDNDGDIQRISNWLVADGERGHTKGLYPIEALYDYFEGRNDVIIIPHQGGRRANIRALDSALTPFLELTSLFGVFEWFGHEALERGYHVGFIGGSDDATGRLGATKPSTSDWWNMTGGLMGVQASELTREALWESFKARRVFATTGARIRLNIDVDGQPMGSTVEVKDSPQVVVEVNGTAPVQRIDLFRGTEPVVSRDCGSGAELIEFVWTGLNSKNRDKYIDWSGELRLNRGKFVDVEEFGFVNPNQGLRVQTQNQVRWEGYTAGNYQGLRLNIEAPDDAIMTFDTNQLRATFRRDDLQDRLTVDAGGLNSRLSIRPIRKAARLDVDMTIEDDTVPTGTYPYYVRVRQADGEMAWSSPIIVTVR